MPYIQYKDVNIKQSTIDKIAIANEILENYARQGFDLTLRQLYYQFVARDLIPNKQSEYDNLGTAINTGRMLGLIDWDHIVDRTRQLKSNAHWRDPAHIIYDVSRAFAIDKWKNQPHYVEVWIEKDALVGVISGICQQLDVAYFSCRGYASQSEMWRAGQRIIRRYERYEDLKSVTILHLGDHDPSGIDMTYDIQRRLDLFTTEHFGSSGWVEVKRIALTMDQINELNPPPNPAKVSDSRSKGYIAKYGRKSWELDALEPAYMNNLIDEEVKLLRDEDLWKEANEEEDRYLAQLEQASERWDDIVSFLEDE